MTGTERSNALVDMARRDRDEKGKLDIAEGFLHGVKRSYVKVLSRRSDATFVFTYLILSNLPFSCATFPVGKFDA